ncbi:adaptin-related protein-like protein [Leishmania donovani]|uniref:Adaptin N terminal region family protein n=1 Tax=Leishmania donovani TaxID=5661 RepID=A0A504WYU4_LEIDO|nr:Adaptin N terminal region family protein [Leishmania donovani]CAJ1986926.1 adaptin-related protein-like protein [Leishmania donovani]VDZ42817.1 adaptin-related_protein-like_protein/GeneDB:LmjF.11.0990 [Leishmania donovani]
MPNVFVTGAAYFSRGFDAPMVKEDLASQNEPRQLSALYQVVAYMTMGKDMSSLFNEVSALTSSANSTMKRLAYLYLMENSRVQPERTVLQAGTFVKDTLHDSPLVRGAGLRTMTGIQLSVMADFDTGPLSRCLEDSSAYVRRIAAMGVLKQYSKAPNVSSASDLLDKLKGLLKDKNAAVAGSAVRAMLELQYRNAPVSYIYALLEARPHLIEMLLHGNEWTTVYLLEGLAIAMMWECHEAVGRERHRRRGLQPSVSSSTGVHSTAELASTALRPGSHPAAHGEDDDELETLRRQYIAEGEETLEAVLPLMQYASPIIVLSAIRVVGLFLHSVTASRLRVPEAEQSRLLQRYTTSLVQPLVELLEAPRFEMQYVVLRNIAQFLTPVFTPYLAAHLSKFLVKFEDPIYVKMEKLNLLVRFANSENGLRVLDELMVYTREADVALVRTAINAIGVLATMLPELSEECVRQLGQLIATRVPHLVEDTVVVVQMVLRCYPGKFTDIIPPLCASLTILGATEAKAAVAWVLGEYPDSVSESVIEYLSVLVNQFMQQPRLVQCATMTALAKLYLRSARHAPGKDSNSAIKNGAQAMLEKVLSACTDSLYPDLRDRAFFYWRLITLDPDVAKRMLTTTEAVKLGANSWDELGHYSSQQPGTGSGLQELGTLASVTSKPLRLLIGDNVIGSSNKCLVGVNDDEDTNSGEEGDNNEANGYTGGSSNGSAAAKVPLATAANTSLTTAHGAAATVLPSSETTTTFSTVLTPAQGNGVQVEMMWSQSGSKLVLCSRLRLVAGEDYMHHTRVLTMQINWNMFGLGVAQVFPTTSLECDDKPTEVSVLVACNNRKSPTAELQVAIELECIGVRYVLAPPIPTAYLLLPATGCEPHFFAEQWRALGHSVWDMPPQLQELKSDPTRLTTNLLRVYCLNLVHRRELPAKGLLVLLLYCETIGHERLLAQATLNVRGSTLIALSVRSADTPVAAYVGEFIMRALCPLSTD